MMARGLDRIVEKPLSERVNEQPLLLTRRDLLKKIGITVLTLAGVGFAGCSSKVSESIEFKSQNPLQSGYKLISPENSKPVPSYSTLQPVIQIGKERGFEVYAPGDIDCYVKGKGEIPIGRVRPGMTIISFPSRNGYNWVIGNIDKYIDGEMGANDFSHIEEISSDVYFVVQNMGDPGALFIIGALGDKAYASLTFIERGGGKVASFLYIRDLKDPRNYSRYAFHSNQKEMLDNMMQTIFNAIAENETLIKQGYMTESMARWLKEHAKDGEWRFIPEAIH